MSTSKNNSQKKLRKLDNPYEIWATPFNEWEWRVLKKWQADDDKPNARWFCAVKSPFTYGGYDYGDVYASDVKEQAYKIYDEEVLKNE